MTLESCDKSDCRLRTPVEWEPNVRLTRGTSQTRLTPSVMVSRHKGIQEASHKSNPHKLEILKGCKGEKNQQERSASAESNRAPARHAHLASACRAGRESALPTQKGGECRTRRHPPPRGSREFTRCWASLLLGKLIRPHRSTHTDQKPCPRCRCFHASCCSALAAHHIADRTFLRRGHRCRA